MDELQGLARRYLEHVKESRRRCAAADAKVKLLPGDPYGKENERVWEQIHDSHGVFEANERLYEAHQKLADRWVDLLMGSEEYDAAHHDTDMVRMARAITAVEAKP